jgi:transposase-like protein
MSRHTYQHEILDEIGIDKIAQMIECDDLSYSAIAKELGVNKTQLIEWIKRKEDRPARIKEARVASALECDALALQALLEITDDLSNAGVTRQREIASHYRWRAKARNPVEYGDRLQTEHSGGVEITSIERVIIDSSDKK